MVYEIIIFSNNVTILDQKRNQPIVANYINTKNTQDRHNRTLILIFWW